MADPSHRVQMGFPPLDCLAPSVYEVLSLGADRTWSCLGSHSRTTLCRLFHPYTDIQREDTSAETLAVSEAGIPCPVWALALMVGPASSRNLKDTVLLVTWYLVAACIPGAKYSTYLVVTLFVTSPLFQPSRHGVWKREGFSDDVLNSDKRWLSSWRSFGAKSEGTSKPLESRHIKTIPSQAKSGELRECLPSRRRRASIL